MVKLSLLAMIGLTVLFSIGLRWREERMQHRNPPPPPARRMGLREGFIAAQKKKLNRWMTAATLAAVATLLFLGGINWLRVWQGQ